ncbi:NAD(P)-dependent dehydrogenase (short-subunit alcohol dehydrogenase family) [Bacillus ectoiniformans]|uniref:SDR family oxidoreductase n=1 Tax=Bacillus ectoiniformans TaxID=1494429 RepID=UPI00195621B3|nr:SDR family oxidoreductase [Bacillus ectoiniformans]MBM7650211.1 NAD(P)-dependent dehydrogenase (short-subunit alcohol dehydrogenase family) [Bacillus ectoiniformans]
MSKKVAFITGASSGFGFLTAIELAKAGIFVIATIRNVHAKDLLLTEARKHNVEENIEVLQLDVTNHQQLEHVKDHVLSIYTSIDYLINNAGYSVGGLAEDLSVEDYKQQFETNLFGVIAVTKAFLPLMRKQRRGKIINIGSISGSFGFPGLTPYVSSKFALKGYSEALRLELLPFHVYVSLIEAGSYKTNIWNKGLKGINLNVDDDYKPIMEMAYNGSIYARDNSEDPMEVVQLIKKIIFTPKPALYYPVGKGVKKMQFLKKILPWSIIEKIVRKKIKKA